MSGPQSDAIAVVVPVLNDWAPAERLIRELDALPALAGRRLLLLMVDDGSVPSPSIAALANSATGAGVVAGIKLVQLASNLGHQRAIAAGLVEASRVDGIGQVVVMDADGEDRPDDVAALIAESDAHGEAIVLALRSRRSEGLGFRVGYAVYRLLFRLLTGNRIQFGNFCLIPRGFLNSLTHNPATWNNLAAAIMRSRLPTVAVPTERGERYGGRSKMNFLSLAVHGLSAISVYIDITLIRVICAALTVGAVALGALAVVLWMKLFAGLAIPGWASTLGASLLVLLFQALLFASVALFQFLSFRSMPTVIPATHVPLLISGVFDVIPVARADDDPPIA
ncbi:MAG TPA: glycosyltransferase [Caulobacteraceae bacterium]